MPGSIWEGQRTSDLYLASGEKPKHSRAAVSNIFIKNPMCQLGKIPLQQREIFLKVTGHLLKPGYQALYVNWVSKVPRMMDYLPQSQHYLCVTHTVAFPLSLCLPEIRTGTRQSRWFNFTKGWKFDLTAGETALGLIRTEEGRNLSLPPTPTSGLASQFQQRIFNSPVFTQGSQRTRIGGRHHCV